jgi:hypothetical protein
MRLWRSRSARKLNPDDAHQIAANMTGFFKILAEWQKKDKGGSKVPHKGEKPTPQ